MRPRRAAVRRAASAKAVARVQNRLLSRQAAVQSRLTRTLRQEQVEYGYSYTALFNGFSVRTARKNLEAIRNTKGVTCAFVAGSYALPTTQQADTQALQVALASSRFTGKGMTIAVLDTGLDTAHPAFANAPADAKFTKDYISGVLQAADLNAEVLMPGVTADDVYLSAKIPFAFDYAGKDAQVAPGSKWDAENLEHGTHVAGIAAGYAVDGEGAVTFSGVAPDAQVIPMKVFDDSGTGAATTTILAALEDAYRLGVDAVNLSLGSYGGFTVDEDALINDVYNKLDDVGIMVITAAGNETSSSYMNSYGTDAPLTGDPDNSVVAAPSVYPANLSVTNADGQEVWSDAVTNVPKTIYVSSQGGPIPATMYQDMAPDAWYGTDNQGSALPDGQYYYTITADPVTDHESRNVRDTLTFPVYIDTQAPQLDQGCVALSTGADGRTTLGMQVSDEHLYLDTEIFVANDDGTISTSSEKLLHKNVGLADMPDVTSDAVSVDVTDYAGKLLYVQLTDWGYNYAAYLVQLPDTFQGTTLSLSDTTAFLFTGEQQQLVAFDTDTDTALTWTSSNADVASVDGSGLVTAKAPGVITATATSTTQDTVQCFVTVVPKWYDGIQATQDTIHLKLGQGADLTQYLTLLDESGVVIPELNPVNYASLDESILSVDASGHVTALHTGTGMVRALLNTGDYTLIAVEVTCDHDHTTRTETPAACTQDGSVTVTCDDCGAVLSTETMPATGHDYKDGKCTVCGAADPDYRPEQPEDPGQPEKPEQPENPGVKTGDSGVLLYMGLMLLALTGSAWVLRKKRAR